MTIWIVEQLDCFARPPPVRDVDVDVDRWRDVLICISCIVQFVTYRCIVQFVTYPYRELSLDDPSTCFRYRCAHPRLVRDVDRWRVEFVEYHYHELSFDGPLSCLRYRIRLPWSDAPDHADLYWAKAQNMSDEICNPKVKHIYKYHEWKKGPPRDMQMS